MKATRRLAWVTAALLLAGAAFTGCNREGGPVFRDAPPVDGRLVYGSIAEPRVLNPILAVDGASLDIVRLVFNGLLRLNDRLEYEPDLARDYVVSKDGLVWTFRLRDDVTWHDGAPCTAEDVVFTFESILHPGYTGVRARNYDALLGARNYFARLDSLRAEKEAGKITDDEYARSTMAAFVDWKANGAVKAVDRHTVRFTLGEPFAPILENLSIEIIPAHILQDAQGAAMAEHPFNKNPVGTGPFRFVNWAGGERIILERNPNYFRRGRPYLGQWVMEIIPDQSTIAAALETGEIDMAPVIADDYERLKASTHLDLYEYPTMGYTYMAFNLANPLFSDARVRQAMAHAVNRQAFVDQILLGHGIVADTHGSPARWDYADNVRTFRYNPIMAHRLLAEAGWRDSNGDGTVDREGREFRFTLLTNHGNRYREAAAVIIQNQLKEIGIGVQIRLVEWATLVNNHLLARNFEAVIAGWGLGIDPDSYAIWHTRGGMNFVSYSNPRLDALLEGGRRETDQAKRKAIYVEIQQILAEDQPYLFLFFPDATVAVNKRFAGPTRGTPAGLLWNIEEWYVPREGQE